MEGDRLRLSSVDKQFLINQLVWIVISFGISITISMLIPFPLSLVVIVGTFLPLYLRRRMMARMGSLNATSIMGGMFSTTAAYSSSPLKYYCMSCGTQHKQVPCPKCGSKMRRIG